MRAQSLSVRSNDDSKRFLSLSRVPTTSTQHTAGWQAIPKNELAGWSSGSCISGLEQFGGVAWARGIVWPRSESVTIKRNTSIYFKEVSLHTFGMCWEVHGTIPVLRTSESFSVVRLSWLSVLFTGFGFPRDWCYAAHRHQNNFDVIKETCVMCEWCGFSSLPLRRKLTDM